MVVLKTKIIIVLAVIIVILAGSVTILIQQVIRAKDIAKRHEFNYNIAINELQSYKTKSGNLAISLQETQLTLKEVKNTSDSVIKSLYDHARDLGNRNRELMQLINLKTETQVDSVFIPILDTVIIRPQDTITRMANYNSKWLDVSLSVKRDNIEVLNYISRDEIIITLAWFKQSKFFIKRWFEKKKYRATIKSLNPNSKITQAKNIRITGKTGR